MSSTILIIIVVAVIVLLLLAVYFSMRRSRAQRSERQRERTREEFGSEYERTAEARGSEEEAGEGAKGTPRAGRAAGGAALRGEPGRYEERWGEVERVFVDNPSRSIELADRTVMEVLEERNFVSDPSQSDEETERSLAVMHPDVADDYREARASAPTSLPAWAGSRKSSEEETTEELRQGIQRYRVVYQRLVSG